MRPFEHYIKGTAPPLFTAFDFIGFQNKRGDPKEKKIISILLFITVIANVEFLFVFYMVKILC